MVVIHTKDAVQHLRNLLDNERITYTIKRQEHNTLGPCPGNGRRYRNRTTANIKQVMGYINSHKINVAHMREYSLTLGQNLRDATDIALDLKRDSETRMNALQLLNDYKHLVCMARLKKMVWVFTFHGYKSQRKIND